MGKILNSVSRTGYVNALPSAKKLNALLRYEKMTGDLYWRAQINPSIKLGIPIGAKQKAKGKRALVRIDNVLFYASRVIWRMVTGIDPGALEIDHEDRDKTNDSWDNLSLTNRQGNVLNVDTEAKAAKCSIAARKRWDAYV